MMLIDNLQITNVHIPYFFNKKLKYIFNVSLKLDLSLELFFSF